MPYPEIRRVNLDKYLSDGFHVIFRQCEAPAIEIIADIDRQLYEQGIDGCFVEIGVLHGASFIAMQHLTDVGVKSLAIDVFDLPGYVIDPRGNGGGRASMAKFRESLERWGRPRDVVTHECDSVALNYLQVSMLASQIGKVKFVSIDGNHTVEHTAADLRTAVQFVQDGGLVVVDDYDNIHWPEVRKATDAFLAEPDCCLRPFAEAHNKLYMLRKG